MNTTVAVMICGKYLALNAGEADLSAKDAAQCRQSLPRIESA